MMKILITNDDSVNSPVLPALAKWAMKLGDVTIAVPKTEQSGKSQAIQFVELIEVKKVEIAPDIFAYAVDSTPADCVRFGVLGLHQTYDLILSGINRGYNLGDDIVYSGTCGAIFEGARLKINGLALSTAPDNLMNAPEALDEVWKFIQDHNLYAYNDLYNVNIPPMPSGIHVTKQGGMFFHDSFLHCDDHMYVQSGEILQDSGTDPTTDINTMRRGEISVTPLIATRTEMPTFEKLKHI